MPVGRLGPGMLAALKKLAAEGGSETELARLVMKAEGARQGAPLQFTQERYTKLQNFVQDAINDALGFQPVQQTTEYQLDLRSELTEAE